MNTKRLASVLAVLAVVAIVVATVMYVWRDDGAISSRSDRRLQKVAFGVLPYLDHTYAVVGKEFGWFADAGIDLELKVVAVEHIVPWLKNGTVDVCSTPPGILMAAWDTASNLRTFVFGNLFTGYAIMAQPDQRYRTYRQFRGEGLDPSVAARRTIAQMTGKRLAYPPEDAIRPFIDLALSKAGMRLADLQTVVLDDPLTVSAMRQRTVDFQTGGAPSRVTLQGEGFLAIFTSLDLLEFARPSDDSPELAGVLQNGWATTKAFYDDRGELILRLASVNYRIMSALQDPNGRARQVHLEYLKQLTGAKAYSPAQVEAFYEELNRFRTFDQQKDWFENTASTQFYKYINGAILKSWTGKKGYFQRTPPSVEDVIFADDTYRRLQALRSEFELKKTAINDASARGKVRLAAGQTSAFERASKQADEWNLVDAVKELRNLGRELGVADPQDPISK